MSRAKGNIAEDRACEYLLSLGFVVAQRNFYSRFGEIDVVAFKDDTIHFVEVKSALDYESAIQNVTPQKIKKLLKTGDVYLKKNNIALAYVYDAVIVTPLQVAIVENITF